MLLGGSTLLGHGADDDMNPAALCRAAPPRGLLDRTSRLRTLLNESASRARPANSSSSGALCLALAAHLKRSIRRFYESYKRCAVVGSGGALRGSKLGRHIDAHDAVFRMNLAPNYQPYAGDAGTRTTFRLATHYPWRILATQKRMKLVRGLSHGGLLLYCHNAWLGQCHVDALNVARVKGLARRFELPSLLSPAAVSRVAAAALRNPRDKRTPSTGLMAVELALRLCHKVSLYGFSIYSHSSCAHYWDAACGDRDGTRAYLAASREHDWLGERRLLAKMVSRSEVIFVV